MPENKNDRVVVACFSSAQAVEQVAVAPSAQAAGQGVGAVDVPATS